LITFATADPCLAQRLVQGVALVGTVQGRRYHRPVSSLALGCTLI
jgi:hypothetical protein